MTTELNAAKSRDACVCKEGYYTADDDHQGCLPCEESLDCLGGTQAPTTRLGYYADTRAVLHPAVAFKGGNLSVFKCFEDVNMCPAGPLVLVQVAG